MPPARPPLPSLERVLPPSANSLCARESARKTQGPWEEAQGPDRRGGLGSVPASLSSSGEREGRKDATSKRSPAPPPRGRDGGGRPPLRPAQSLECRTVLVSFPGGLGVDAGQEHMPWPLTKTGTQCPSQPPRRVLPHISGLSAWGGGPSLLLPPQPLPSPSRLWMCLHLNHCGPQISGCRFSLPESSGVLKNWNYFLAVVFWLKFCLRMLEPRNEV